MSIKMKLLESAGARCDDLSPLRGGAERATICPAVVSNLVVGRGPRDIGWS